MHDPKSDDLSGSLDIPDFRRSIFCIFGLVFDNVDVEEALEVIYDAVRHGRKCMISTPNLNFVVRSAFDRTFRNSVLRSDLSLVDGMPLVWAGRWFGVRVKARVAGSSIFDRMRRGTGAANPVRIYLFGGPPGVARLASERLNAEAGGVRCVGYRTPGYGSVDEMSGPDIIRDINASGADFVMVALGAAKGQAWIQRNRAALQAPVISHLGAVINLTAGTIRRAPLWMQNAGLEWLWRIYLEPYLWRRYAGDAVVALGLVARASRAAVLAGLAIPRSVHGVPPEISIAETETEITVILAGAWTARHSAPLREALIAHAADPRRLRLDVTGVATLDSGTVALLLVARRYRLDAGLRWNMTGVSPGVTRHLETYRAEELLL